MGPVCLVSGGRCSAIIEMLRQRGERDIFRISDSGKIAGCMGLMGPGAGSADGAITGPVALSQALKANDPCVLGPAERAAHERGEGVMDPDFEFKP